MWHSKRFLLILCGNHWKCLECHTILAKNMKTCSTSSVFADFMWKSLKTLGVSHFSCKKHAKVWHFKRVGWFWVKIIENAGRVTLFSEKAWTVWHFKRFLLILFDNHWKRLECHTFLAKSIKKSWHFKRCCWF